MALGRCSGCGFSDSGKKVNTHVLTCGRYLQLFRVAPDRCLDPVAEHERYRQEDDTSEARAARRDVRLRERFAELDVQHNIQTQRWRRSTDILED